MNKFHFWGIFMKINSIIFTTFFTVLSSFSPAKASIGPEFVTIYVHGTQEWWLKATLHSDLWYCPVGLHHISELPDSSRMKKDAELMFQVDPKFFAFEHYYIFGWPGNLSFQVRQEAGYQLFKDIKKLLILYQEKYNIIPKVRLIGFSHGSNIVLHVLSFLPYFQDINVYTEVMLLVCPVQKPTESYIQSSFVNRAYVLCADNDYVQRMDWYKYQGSWYLPTKFFATNQSNILQYSIFVNNRALSHTDFMHAFMLHIPYVRKISELYFIDQNKFEQQKNIKKMNHSVSNNNYFELNICDEKYIYYSLFDTKGLYGIRYV